MTRFQKLVERYESATGKRAPRGTSTMAMLQLVTQAERALAASLKNAAVEQLTADEGDDFLPSEVNELVSEMKGGE